MLLSGNRIRQQMASGNIVIKPFDSRHVNPNSVNLTLYHEILAYDDQILNMAFEEKAHKIPIPQAEEQLKQHLPVSLPEGMRKKLIDAANNHNLTLNQYILKVLKEGLAKEGK